jgi:GcrA cell cycle regulator
MDTVWTAERINMLSRLWEEGLSTAEIGRRLGLTKNAVIGKAHRLGLKGRPSPVKAPPPQPLRPVVVGFSGPTCSWPFGHPGERDFHFCGARALPGKPYCAEHSAIAYVRPKGRETNAA